MKFVIPKQHVPNNSSVETMCLGACPKNKQELVPTTTIEYQV
jgi:hypothetical protein